MVRRILLVIALVAGGAIAGRAHAGLLKFEPDIINSHITATVSEPISAITDNTNVTSTLRVLSGEIEGDPKNPAATGKVKLVVDATSFQSGNQMRNKHILGDSLETADYPTIEFDSTALKDVELTPQGDGGNATVLGNLTLHGVTRPIGVPLEASLDPDGGFTAWGEFSVDYTDYGIKPPRLLFALPVGKEVKISFRIKALPPGAPMGPTPSPTPTGPSFWHEFVDKVLK